MQAVFQTVCVVGLGYIGLPTASLLANKGFRVLGCDVNPEVVATINRGDIHIVEQDLDILVRGAVHSGQLQAFSEPQPAEVFIVAVPTPFQDNHVPDIRYVEAATKALAPCLKPGNLIILESTSPVGTTEKMAEWIHQARPDLSKEAIHVAHCPERVLPGQILHELVNNDRIIGGLTPKDAELARQFYATFVQGEILLTDARTAELCKLTENAFRDVNIAFANELSLICDEIGVNVWELIKLANHHPRVNILQPGPGVGGHCIAVDPWFIVDAAPKQAQLIKTARIVNDNKPTQVIQAVKNACQKLNAPRIACLGLAFKADIGDLRESPSLMIVEKLAREKLGQLWVVEPYIETLPKSLVPFADQVTLVDDVTAAIQQADIVMLLVNHRVFSAIKRETLREKIIIDTRGMWQ